MINKMILMLMNLMNMNAIFVNHPMSLGLIIILQTILLSMKMSTMMKNSWLSSILFISMIGGIMVMFAYMSSLASNEKFKLSKSMMFNNLMIIMLMIMLIKSKKMNILLNEYLELNFINKTNFIKMNKNESMKSISKLFSYYKSNMTTILIFLLYLMLIFTSIMNVSFKGPLKIK
nr:NADH dehydrogenase subunit 6 [Metanigrus sp.]